MRERLSINYFSDNDHKIEHTLEFNLKKKFNYASNKNNVYTILKF